MSFLCRQSHVTGDCLWSVESSSQIAYAVFTTLLLLLIIGIQTLGRFGQRPELSQSTGIALVRCILGKFLGVVCHCFPPPLNVPTFASTTREILAEEGGTVGENVVR